MGGVDLWQNEDENYDNFDPQSMHDKILEVVIISGTWHLGKLQVHTLVATWSDLKKIHFLLLPVLPSFCLIIVTYHLICTSVAQLFVFFFQIMVV